MFSSNKLCARHDTVTGNSLCPCYILQVRMPECEPPVCQGSHTNQAYVHSTMLHEQLTLQMTWLRWWVPADNVNKIAATAFCCYSTLVLQHDTCLSRLAGKDA